MIDNNSFCAMNKEEMTNTDGGCYYCYYPYYYYPYYYHSYYQAPIQNDPYVSRAYGASNYFQSGIDPFNWQMG